MISTFDDEFLKRNDKLIKSLLSMKSSSKENFREKPQHLEKSREFVRQIRIHDRNVTRLRDVRIGRNAYTR